MPKSRKRERYARWDLESTRAFIRLIFTEKELKEKIISLKKYKEGTETGSKHMEYGAVKMFAVRIGFLPDESRELTVKMINIVNSFERKPGLFRLFVKAWEVASRLQKQPDKTVEKPLLNGLVIEESSLLRSTELTENTQTADQQLLDELVEEASKKVMESKRSPKIQKPNGSEAPNLQPRNRRTKVPGQHQEQEPSLEAPSLMQNSSHFEFMEPGNRVQLDFNEEQLSRAEQSQVAANVSDFELVNEAKDLRLRELPADIFNLVQNSCKLVRKMKDKQRRKDIESIIQNHLEYIFLCDSWQKNDCLWEATKCLFELITKDALRQIERSH